MKNKYDGGKFEDYDRFVDVTLKVIEKVVEKTGDKLEVGILCSTENAIKLINKFIRNGVDLAYVEDTIAPETDNCSLFGGYRVVGICEDKLSLYCSDILEEYEFDELLIENNSRTCLIVDYCECREDIITFEFINTDNKCDDKCECSYESEHESEHESECNHKEENNNHDDKYKQIQDTDCKFVVNVNIDDDEMTFKFNNYNDMNEFCNLCEQVLGID